MTSSLDAKWLYKNPAASYEDSWTVRIKNMPDSQQGKSSFGHIERQVVLPLRKSIEIAFKSISVRFVRSMITTLSLVLAVAFLCYTNVNIDVVNGLLATGDADMRQQVLHGYLTMIMYVSFPANVKTEEINRRLIAAGTDDAAIEVSIKKLKP